VSCLVGRQLLFFFQQCNFKQWIIKGELVGRGESNNAPTDNNDVSLLHFVWFCTSLNQEHDQFLTAVNSINEGLFYISSF